MKQILKRGLAWLLTISLLGGNVLAVAPDYAALSLDEDALRLEILGDSALSNAYPHGLFNLMGTEYEMEEDGDSFEIAIARQGGTQGEATVTFNLYDMTAVYGRDYVVEVQKGLRRVSLDVNPDAETLLDLSQLGEAINLSDQVPEDELALEDEPTVEDEATLEDEPLVEDEPTVEDEPLVQDMAPAMEEPKGNQPASLRSLREAALDVESDRPTWEMDSQMALEMEKDAYDAAFSDVPHTSVDITFQEGEYIKYLYINPVDDDVFRGGVQALIALTDPSEGAFRGDNYMANINIMEDEEEPNWGFHMVNQLVHVPADKDKVTVTVARETGIEAPAVIQVGTAADTALAGEDYREGVQTVLFPAGVMEQTVEVDILPNPDRTQERSFGIIVDGNPDNITADRYYTTVTLAANSIPMVMMSADAMEPMMAAANTRNAWNPYDGYAETIASGWSPSKGVWQLYMDDNFPRQSNTPILTDRAASVQVFGGNASGSVMNNRIKFYGVDKMSWLSSNFGQARSYEVNEAGKVARFFGFDDWHTYYDKSYDGWILITGYGDVSWGIFKPIAGMAAFYKGSGNNQRYEVHNVTVPKSCWNTANITIGARSVSAASSHYIVDDLQLHLKPYTINIEGLPAVPLNNYTLNDAGELVLAETYENSAPATINLVAVGSKVGNSQPNIASTINTVTAYRSDYIALTSAEHSAYAEYGSLEGYEYRIGGGNWIPFEGPGLALDTAFFAANNKALSENSTITIRPIWTRYDVKNTTVTYVEGTMDHTGIGVIGVGNSTNAGAATSKTFGFNVLKRGDKLTALGQRTNSTLTPVWSQHSWDDVDRNHLYPEMAEAAIAGQDEGMAKTAIMYQEYNTLTFTLGSPELLVRSAPDVYSHHVESFANGDANYYTTFTMNGVIYQGYTDALKTALGKNGGTAPSGDTQMTISFSYTWEDIVGRLDDGTMSDADENEADKTYLGNIPTAILTIYDRDGKVKSTHEIAPTGGNYPDDLSATYTLTGTLDELGWETSDAATVYFVGSNTIADIFTGASYPARTMEMGIDFLVGSANAVVVTGETGDGGISQIGNPFWLKEADHTTPYTLLSIPFAGMQTRWINGSLDADNDGINDVADSGNEFFFATTFPYAMEYQGVNKFYYDYVQSITGQKAGTIEVNLVEQTRVAINSNQVYERPLDGATVYLMGVEIGETDAKGHLAYTAYGIQRGQNYVLTVTYEGNSYNVYATANQGATTTKLDFGTLLHAEIPYNGLIQYREVTDGALATGGTTTVAEVYPMTASGTALNSGLGYRYGMTFTLGGTSAQKPNRAQVIVYDYSSGTGEAIYKSSPITVNGDGYTFVLDKDHVMEPAAFVETAKMDSYEIVIHAWQEDSQGAAQYTFPDMPTGLTFKAAPMLLESMASFAGPSADVDIVGNIDCEYQFSVRVNTDQLNLPRYVIDENGEYTKKPMLSMGFSIGNVTDSALPTQNFPVKNEVVTNEIPGNAKPKIIDPLTPPASEESSEVNRKEVTAVDQLENVFGGQDVEDVTTTLNDPDSGLTVPKGSGMGNIPENATTEFGWKIDIGCELTYSIPYVKNSYGEAVQSSRIFFDSMVLTVTGLAEYTAKAEYSIVGIPVFAVMRLTGQMTAIVAVEAADQDPYRQEYKREYSMIGNGPIVTDEDGNKQYYYVYELNEMGIPTVFEALAESGHSSPDDFFDYYARLLLYPQLKLSAGVGTSSVNAYLSGAAIFDMEFNSQGGSEAAGYGSGDSSGQGGITLSAGFGIKIFFVQLDWEIASKRWEMFEYGTRNAAALSAMAMNELSDPYTNYLYDDTSEATAVSRDYLQASSDWNGNTNPVGPMRASASPFLAMGADVPTQVKENIIKTGMYPDPKNKLVDLGDGKFFMVFVDDDQTRNDENRAAVYYSYFDGYAWTEPVMVDNDSDGTWDDNPDAQLVDGKILVTYSDADIQFTEDMEPIFATSAINISGRWFDTHGTPDGDSFAITWTSDNDGDVVENPPSNPEDLIANKDEVFDMMGDTDPCISYDPITDTLMVYYTKSDYLSEVDFAEGEEVLIGHLINPYTAIAYRTATKNDQGEFEWATDSENHGFYGQKFLELAPIATIEEEVVTAVDDTVTHDADSDYQVTRNAVKQTVIPSNSTTDPLVTMADVTTYNGLALYAYVMDEDANKESLTDQDLYLQIYDYENDYFTYPIQLTNNSVQDTNPQFVRVSGITYLYFIQDGNIRYMDITNMVKHADMEESYGGLKQVDVDGKTLYIVDKSQMSTTDEYINTAVERTVTYNEDGSVLSTQPITDYQVKTDDGSNVYLLWNDYTDGLAEGIDPDSLEARKSENQLTSKIIYAAYQEAPISLTHERQENYYADGTYEGNTYSFIFENDDRSTYPTAYIIDADTVPVLIDYDEVRDVNGYRGVVSAGDPVLKEVQTVNENAHGWSQPVAITKAEGLCYDDISFVVNGENDLSMVYLRYKEHEPVVETDANGNITSNIKGDMMDLSTTELVYSKFTFAGDLALGDVTYDLETPKGGDVLTFQMDLTNQGLAPAEDVTVTPLAIQNGQALELEVGSDSVTTDVIGGQTIRYSAAVELPENMEGITVGFEVDGETVSCDLDARVLVMADPVNTTLLSADQASITVQLDGKGNLPYVGSVQVAHGETKEVLATEEITLAADGAQSITFLLDIDKAMFTEQGNVYEDGSVGDCIPLTITLLDETGTALAGNVEYPSTVGLSVTKLATAQQVADMDNMLAFTMPGTQYVKAGRGTVLTPTVKYQTPLVVPTTADGEAGEPVNPTPIRWSSNSQWVSVNRDGEVTVSADAPTGTRATITARVAPNATQVLGYVDGSFSGQDAIDLLPDSVVETYTTTVIVGTRPSSNHVSGGDTTEEPEEETGGFTDVSTEDWYSDAVDFVVKEGLFQGTSDTTFEPETPMTRGMLATVLHRLAGEPEATQVFTFGDLSADDWYYDAVMWAAEQGIIKGYTDGNFGGADMITREQMASVLYRYCENPNTQTDVSSFVDGSDISPYANDAMAWAVEIGLIQGVGNNTLVPQGDATRAQVATIFMRFAQMQ